MDAPEGKRFYGSVTVSERGQIVIPAETRKDFSIKTSDKLLVFGDLKTGIWITTFDVIQKTYGDLFRAIGMPMKNKEGHISRTNRKKREQ